MAAQDAASAVRNYLAALKDVSALIDEAKVADLERKIEASQDDLERLQLRQRLLEAQNPSLERLEEDFVAHAKSWAESEGVSDAAFIAEGVSAQVLRRAGFREVGGRGRRRRSGGGRTRVTADQVRDAIPRGSFTIKTLQERSGGSPAVVRRVVQEEEAAGRLVAVGGDPSHRGPGRTPTLYRKK